MFNPKDPDSYFDTFKEMKSHAAKIQESLLREASEIKTDAFSFFNDIKKDQADLTTSQEQLHKGVIAIENEWKDMKGTSGMHTQYRAAVQFFSDKQNNMKVMTEKMEVLTERVAKIETLSD